jgi:hypothetical protein
MDRGIWHFDEDGLRFTPVDDNTELIPDVEVFYANYFMSGYSDEALNIWGDGEEAHFVISGLLEGKIYHKSVDASVVPGWKGKICLCGPIIKSPVLLASFCKSYPNQSIYVCPVVDSLDALGTLLFHANQEGQKPYRANLYHKDFEIIEDSIEVMDFEDNLEGDSLGRMAHLVGNGVPVLNQVRTSPSVSPFYGKILSDQPLGDDAAYAIRSELIDLYFPSEPLSLKYCVSTSALVHVTNTDKFKEVSGYEGDSLSILAVSDYILDLPTFMKFYVLIAKTGFVAVNEIESLKDEKIVPVFRYNKGYKLSADNFRRNFTK